MDIDFDAAARKFAKDQGSRRKKEEQKKAQLVRRVPSSDRLAEVSHDNRRPSRPPDRAISTHAAAHPSSSRRRPNELARRRSRSGGSVRQSSGGLRSSQRRQRWRSSARRI